MERFSTIAVSVLAVLLLPLSPNVNRGLNALAIANAQNLEIARQPHDIGAGAYVLACRLVGIYQRLAPEYLKSKYPNSRIQDAVSKNDCVIIDDNDDWVKENRYRIQKTDVGYVCIQDAMPLEETLPAECYWTSMTNLKFVGRGPQLSDEQFAQVIQLYKRARHLDALAADYRATGNRRESDDYSRQAVELRTQAVAIGH